MNKTTQAKIATISAIALIADPIHDKKSNLKRKYRANRRTYTERQIMLENQRTQA